MWGRLGAFDGSILLISATRMPHAGSNVTLADIVMLSLVSPIASPRLRLLSLQILGPRGLMPNPKLGTVTPNIKEAVAAAKKGQAEFRAEKRGLVMAGIGKASFEPGHLRENLRSFLLSLGDAKPEGLKGAYIRGGFIKSTMGPGFPLDPTRLDPTSPFFLDSPPVAAAPAPGTQ